MSNRVRVALFAVLSLGIAFVYGTSLATAQSTQEEMLAPGTQEEKSKGKEKNKGKEKSKDKGDGYQKNFPKEEFSNTGTNPYFKLEPGYVLVLKGNEDGQNVVLTITVTENTEEIDGVETRVVEEREEKDGELFEVSRNYFVIGQRTNNVYYFGEDVDFYENGVIVGHDGTWRHGVNGARYGMIMPGNVEVGQKYYQEIAPGVALDRAEHVSLIRNILKVRETTPLEPDVEEFKFYAPGVGLVKAGDLELTPAEPDDHQRGGEGSEPDERDPAEPADHQRDQPEPEPGERDPAEPADRYGYLGT